MTRSQYTLYSCTAADLWNHHKLIHPEQEYKVYWDLVIGLIIIYSVIVVPFRLSFAVEAEGVSVIVDMIMDIMFGMDMCFTFFTAFVNHRCELIYNRRAIRIHYLTSLRTK